MSSSKNIFYITVILTVIVCLCTEQVEGRRTILKGRRALTRTYYYDSALPAWITVILIALAEVIFGGVLYLILKKVVIDPPMTGSYAVQNY
ncbi:hypothetical protein WA026_016424 [Henosepilachna vigintioctopunctata]|uniref:Uncharacterized protein n=1 Tax=Henosepilachna vigintioctopunctata TaxID=420089 RepID=A0AAW1UD34_9CUCU